MMAQQRYSIHGLTTACRYSTSQKCVISNRAWHRSNLHWQRIKQRPNICSNRSSGAKQTTFPKAALSLFGRDRGAGGERRAGGAGRRLSQVIRTHPSLRIHIHTMRRHCVYIRNIFNFKYLACHPFRNQGIWLSTLSLSPKENLEKYEKSPTFQNFRSQILFS